jgi:type IV pilus assembly protein PilO
MVLVGLIAAAYFVIFEPNNKEIAEAKSAIATKQAKLATLAEKTSNIGDIEAKIAELEDAIAHFQSMLPNDREVETLLREVWELAGEHDLTAKSVRPDKPVKAAQYEELPIKMTILGDFDGLYSFIQDIEKLPRITRMPRIRVVKQSGEDAEGMVQADLTLSIFFEGNTPTQTASR